MAGLGDLGPLLKELEVAPTTLGGGQRCVTVVAG